MIKLKYISVEVLTEDNFVNTIELIHFFNITYRFNKLIFLK